MDTLKGVNVTSACVFLDGFFPIKPRYAYRYTRTDTKRPVGRGHSPIDQSESLIHAHLHVPLSISIIITIAPSSCRPRRLAAASVVEYNVVPFSIQPRPLNDPKLPRLIPLSSFSVDCARVFVGSAVPRGLGGPGRIYRLVRLMLRSH